MTESKQSKKNELWPFDEGYQAYIDGIPRTGEIPFYNDHEDECLWVDGWDYAEQLTKTNKETQNDKS